MKTQIVTRHDGLPPKFRERSTAVVERGLRRFRSRLRRVRVVVVDENGPRGGVDTRCRVMLETRHGRPIVTQGLASNAHAALRLALDRARARLRGRRLGTGFAAARAARRQAWEGAS